MNKSFGFYDIFESSFGRLYLVFSGKYLSGVSFEKPFGIPFKHGSAPAEFIEELGLYFEGSKDFFKQRVEFLTGTDFEKQVWSALKNIPYGETRSYKWVAETIGNPSATRAVGRALSKNPVPIVVPCHRVIEADGSLGGYSSGIERKQRLLEMEYYAKMNKDNEE